MNTIRLDAGHKQAALEVLSTAFYDYPVMRYVLKDAGEQYSSHLQALIAFFLETRFSRNWPVLAKEVNNEIVAVAGINEPVDMPWPPSLQKTFDELSDLVGNVATERLVTFEDKCSEFEPKEAHYFLGIIGVLPQYSGQGLAQNLISEIIESSRSNVLSNGVCLTTEDPTNVGFYQYLGFEIIKEADIGDLHTWCMYRPDGRN